MGWMVGVGVLLITLGVVFGLVGIAVVARRKQQYRIQNPPEAVPAAPSPTQGPPARP